MRTAAILPVRHFADAKRRLRDELAPASRRALAEAMFCDVLIALRKTEGIKAIVVVSADPIARRIAARQGAATLEDDEQGHNAAAELGIRAAIQRKADRALLVPGDCPLLDPRELDALLARPAPTPSVLIVPDRHGTGTNALLLAPPDALAPSFGPESCGRHLATARSNALHAEIGQLKSLALDVDTPEDLAALQATLRPAPGAALRTHRVIDQLVSERA
jgi:2-phospho-L-lactate guanylyltransferase